MQNELGHVLRQARDEMSRRLEREVAGEDVADALKARGIPMERKTWSNLETGRTRTIRPEVANELPSILPVTVLQIVQALGFAVAFEGVSTEEDAAVLEAYQSASDETRRIVRLALGLGAPPPPHARGRSLTRLAATDRPDRPETQE